MILEYILTISMMVLVAVQGVDLFKEVEDESKRRPQTLESITKELMGENHAVKKYKFRDKFTKTPKKSR